MATALVFFMMPGLALFYGGLVGEKNVIATVAQSFVRHRLRALDHGGLLPGLRTRSRRSHRRLSERNAARDTKPTSFAPHIPPLPFMALQMMFAVIRLFGSTGVVSF